MKTNQKGFSVVEIVIVVAVVGLLGAVGWLVYDRQKSKESTVAQANQQSAKDNTQEVAQEAGPRTVDGITYTVPADWKNAEGPSKDDKIGSGAYLLSPDYKEAGEGRLFIQAGAYINFQKLEWVGIDSNTTTEQALNVVKNGQGGYLDSESIKLIPVGGKQVITFNSGHTTDGVTVLYKTSSGQWLEAGFTTIPGDDGGTYNAQDSVHYKTFVSWLETFITLNP